MLKSAAIVIALTALGLAGCATNPVTGGKDIAIVSESKAIASAKKDYKKEIASLRSAGKIIDSGPVYGRVLIATSRIIRQARLLRPESQAWDWEVTLVDAPKTFNASCMAGGKLLVYSGFVTGMDLTDDEVAQIMGHEVSHALLNHSRERMSIDILSTIVGFGMIAGGLPYGSDVATNLILTLPLSRSDEAEADRLGLELAARAGVDPAAAVSLWEKMMAKGGSSRTRLDFWSTHPATPKRIDTLTQMRVSMQPIYLEAIGQVDAVAP